MSTQVSTNRQSGSGTPATGSGRPERPRPLTTAQATTLVAEREILTQVRSKSFIISTLITVVLIFGGIVAAQLVGGSGFGGGDTPSVAVVDGVPTDAYEAAADAGTLTPQGVPDRAAAEELLRDGDVDAALVPSAQAPGGFVVLGLDSEPGSVVTALTVAPQVELLEPQTTSDGLRYLVALAFGLVFMISALGSGSMIMQNTITEKQSRIVEILLAAVPARALLAGKILGNSVIGVGNAVVMAAAAALGLVVTGQTELLDMLTAPMVWFVVFFVFGFVLVASIFAAGASLVSRQEDAGSVMTPAMMLIMIPYFGVAFFGTNATVMTVLSYIPFSAPVAMPTRLFFGDAVWWEPLASLAILVLCTLAVVAVAARIYTGSLLRTGARVKVRDALRGE
ncbi:MAG TPA: sodium ABC transporter permease [Micrococcales bacterium]|uniref:ABC transporter permease n=1 Tax=Miniimonas arenae TaxID=676201 RepID=UPI000EE74079|nr:ABC transporter permease [Miniimonas arenae]HCX85324.1 sodium ABC transporter permease [Micrococcales bacterium]